MCVTDEKEGTFCSSECHQAFVSGVPVAQPAGAAAASGDDALSSIFDAEPAPSSNLNLPPSDGPEPIVAEGTKWRPIGAKCENHGDTDAVANCDRCGKAVCPLCLLEAAAGTFCSSDCMSGTAQPAAAEQEALQAPPVPVPAAPAAPQPQRRAQPVNVMATGRAQKKSGGGMAAAVIFLLLGAGGYFGWDYYEKNLAPKPVEPPPVVVVEPPKPVVQPPKPVVEPPKPAVQPPKPVVEPPKPVVQPPKPVVQPPKPVTPVAVTEPVKKPVKKEPPRPRPAKFFNPWGAEDVGTWYRIRTDQNGATTYTDTGVKAKGDGFTVLQIQVCKDGQAGPVTEQKVEPQVVFLSGEQSFTYNDRPFLTEIRQYGQDPEAPKVWSLLQGQNFGAVIQAETPQGLLTARRVWEHTLRINQRSFECLVVEATIEKNAAVVSTVKTWFSPQVPMGFVREERAGQVRSVVAWGMDWARRPAFPTP